MLVAWERLGKYVKQPSRKLANVSEEKDLRLKWNALVQHLDGYPRFVAQPGREWVLVEHGRLPTLSSAVGPDKKITVIARDINNKFALVTVD